MQRLARGKHLRKCSFFLPKSTYLRWGQGLDSCGGSQLTCRRKEQLQGLQGMARIAVRPLGDGCDGGVRDRQQVRGSDGGEQLCDVQGGEGVEGDAASPGVLQGGPDLLWQETVQGVRKGWIYGLTSIEVGQGMPLLVKQL